MFQKLEAIQRAMEAAKQLATKKQREAIEQRSQEESYRKELLQRAIMAFAPRKILEEINIGVLNHSGQVSDGYDRVYLFGITLTILVPLIVTKAVMR